jgi:DNA sulfur modification protein DndB
MALAHVAKMAKNKGIEWSDAVEKLNKISWSFDNDIWFNLLVIGSTNKKMITGKEAVRGVGMVISYLVMGDKMTNAELADVKTVYTNAKNNPDEPLPARV